MKTSRTSTKQEEIQNLNKINKGIARSFRIHTRKGNLKIVKTLSRMLNNNNERILCLMTSDLAT